MPSATIATITNYNSELHNPGVLQQQNATTRRAPVVARLTLHPESHWTGKHQSWLLMVVSLITKSCTFQRICVCAPLPPGYDGHVTFLRRSRSCEFPSGSRKLLGHHLSGARLRTQGPAADRLRKSLFPCFALNRQQLKFSSCWATLPLAPKHSKPTKPRSITSAG